SSKCRGRASMARSIAASCRRCSTLPSKVSASSTRRSAVSSASDLHDARVPHAPRVALVATRSVGKLRELRPLFASHGIAVVDLAEAGIPESADEDPLEAFATFEENALAKARYFFERTGQPTFADDSGLEVSALGGAPGVLSKRWSGRTDLS